MTPSSFSSIASSARLSLAFDQGTLNFHHSKPSSPLLAFESPPRTETFAFVDSFIQAAWECDEGDQVLRQDFALIEHHLSGKRVPADTLLSYLTLKVYLDPRDDVKSLIESYLSALSSEKKKGHNLDWNVWRVKYAHLMYLYVQCLVAMGQVEAAQSAIEPHRVDSALLTAEARANLEQVLIRLIRPASKPTATAAAASTGPPLPAAPPPPSAPPPPPATPPALVYGATASVALCLLVILYANRKRLPSLSMLMFGDV